MPLYPPAGGAGGAAISAGTQSQNTGTVVFSNSNGISFGLNNGTLTATVTPGAAAGVAAAAAGTQTQTSGTLVFANSNGATFGMSGSSQVTMDFGSSRLAGTGFTSTTTVGTAPNGTLNTAGLSMAFPNVLTTARASNDGVGLNTAQTNVTWTVNSAGISVNAAGYAGTGFTSTTIAGVEVEATLNTAGLSMAMPNFLTTAQPVGAYLTTARASNDAIGLNTALTANGVSMTANSSGLSLNFPAFLTTAAQSNHSHGNPQLNLTNLTGTTASNSAGFTLSLSAAAPAAGVGIAAGTRTATTAGTILFDNANGVTFGLNGVGGSVMTASHNGLTTARASNDAIGLATAQTNVTWTVNSAGLSMNAAGYAGTGTTFNGANVSGSMTMNSVGLQLSLSAGAGGGGTAVTMYATSNTTQSSTGTQALSSMMFAGAGIASVGVSNGSVVISVPAGGGAGDGGNIVSMLTSTSGGGTAGATFSNSTASIGLMAGSNITLSQTSNTIVFNAPASSSLVGASNISVSTNGSTISVYNRPRSSQVFPQMQMSVLGAMGNGSFSLAYRDVLMPVTATRVDAMFHWQQASTANANTIAIAMTILCGIYTRNASTLNTVSSASTQTTYTYASNSAGNTQLTGAAYRPVSIPMNVNMTPGAYYMGFGVRTATSSIGTATTTAAQTISAVGAPMGSSAVPWTDEFTRVTNTSVGFLSGHGVYSTTVSSVVPAISLSAINQSGSYFHRANIALVFRG